MPQQKVLVGNINATLTSFVSILNPGEIIGSFLTGFENKDEILLYSVIYNILPN
jgi:hypothetical protein